MPKEFMHIEPDKDKLPKKLVNLISETWELHRKNERLLEEFKQETKLQKKEMDHRMKETDRVMGKLGSRFGELIEHMIVPNITEKFNAKGFHFNGCMQNTEIFENGKAAAEIDILLENDSSTVAVEVKSKPNITDIKEHIKRLEVLRRYKDRVHDRRKIHGAVAGAIMSANVKEYAKKMGFYVIKQTGDTVHIDIPEGFKPREW
jgi:hypothetical protein